MTTVIMHSTMIITAKTLTAARASTKPDGNSFVIRVCHKTMRDYNCNNILLLISLPDESGIFVN